MTAYTNDLLSYVALSCTLQAVFDPIEVGDIATASSEAPYEVYSDMPEDVVQALSNDITQAVCGVNRDSLLLVSDMISAAFDDLLNDTETVSDTLDNPWLATFIVEAISANSEVGNTTNAVNLLANLIVLRDLIDNASQADIVDILTVSNIIDQQVSTIRDLISTVIVDAASDYTMTIVTDLESSVGVQDTSLLTALINAVVESQAVAFITIKFDGETYSGWVVNMETNAASEYSLPEINSMAGFDGHYLAAGPAGIYEFTGPKDDSAVIPAYLKTGFMQFGSDGLKRVAKAYLAYNADGDVRLKVITSLHGKLSENWYTLTAHTGDKVDTSKIPIGQGLKGRYWQFEIVSVADQATFNEIGLLPVILSRRV